MIELVEYGTTQVELTPADVTALLPFVRGGSAEGDDARILQAITPTSQPGVYDVRAGPYVGRLGLPSGRWIDFVSRFQLDDVVRLILNAWQMPAKITAPIVPAASARFFVDAIAASFIRETDRVVRSGLVKEYRVERQTRPPYGGRLDTTYHLSRLAGRPDRVATTSRRMTPDVAANRLLVSALDILRRLPLPPGLARELAYVWPAFARITRVQMGLRSAAEAARGAPARYKRAALLAEMIIQSQALAPVGAGLHMPSLLFYMPPVWEAFVARWAQQLNPGYRVEAGHRFRLSSSGVWARADAVARDGSADDRVVTVYDAKYKWPTSAPRAADLYQMVAYCTALGVTEATLVYPVAAVPRRVQVGDKTINVVGVPPTAVNELADDRATWQVLRVAPPAP